MENKSKGLFIFQIILIIADLVLLTYSIVLFSMAVSAFISGEAVEVFAGGVFSFLLEIIFAFPTCLCGIVSFAIALKRYESKNKFCLACLIISIVTIVLPPAFIGLILIIF